ncbi:MAG: NUDIX domain-containing protein [Candidatus Aenigmarchaeota archaeon]|nr:NUDIX domain-containing protein [Candidatus Aenigmarchaeota archaeon]
MIGFISTTKCYIEKGGKFLMLHKSKNKKKFPDCWMGPGGKQEPEESIIKTCIREVKEETDIDIEKPELKIIATHHYPHKEEVYLVFIFVADWISGEPKKSDDGELIWIDKEKITSLEKLHSDLKWHIPILLENRNGIVFTHNEFDESGKVVKHKIFGEQL